MDPSLVTESGSHPEYCILWTEKEMMDTLEKEVIFRYIVS